MRYFKHNFWMKGIGLFCIGLFFIAGCSLANSAVSETTGPETPAPAVTETRPASPTPSPLPPQATQTPTPVPPTPTATPTPTPTPVPPTLTPTPSPTSTPIPTIPPTFTPLPTVTLTPVAAAPEPASPPGTAEPEEDSQSAAYRYVPLGPAQPDLSQPCPGCPRAPGYIVGRVVDAADRPLPGVRLVCYNSWHRYPVVGSKGGGEYDFPILQAPATWYVTVLDEADQPLSQPAPVEFDPAVACWYRLDWRRID